MKGQISTSERGVHNFSLSVICRSWPRALDSTLLEFDFGQCILLYAVIPFSIVLPGAYAQSRDGYYQNTSNNSAGPFQFSFHVAFARNGFDILAARSEMKVEK